MVRFLHIADLHLGMRITRFSPDAIDRVREARFEALENVRDRLRDPRNGFHFLIIAGDLFDDVRVKKSIARRAFDLLESFPVPVLVLTGNHDPLEPGSVWDSDPWNQTDAKQVRLLTEARPVAIHPGVTLFPCPVLRKTSTLDPTRWIADHPRTPDHGVRIAVAHGSVMDRPNLPDDDHPIAPTAPQDLDLDYIALGHWHKTKVFRDGGGHPRMIYPGVHEPMRFRGDSSSSGWRPYAAGGDRDEFFDDGQGTAIAVTIPGPGAPPQVEQLDVGHLTWTMRHETLHTEEEFDELIAAIAEAPRPELTLLRLKLSGVVQMQAMQRLDELREVMGRYIVGELDDSALGVEPTEAEIREVVGTGVLSSVYQELQERVAAADGRNRAVAERATRLLYRFARQAQES